MRGHYDHHPFQAESTHNPDLLPKRTRASPVTLSSDPYAILDHIPFSHCSGEAPACFQEAKMIPQSCRVLWAETFGEVCSALADAANPIQHPENQTNYELTLERRVKMFFIIPFLILRKTPDKSTPCPINNKIKQRLGMWKSRDYSTLIQEYERDVVYIQLMDEDTVPCNNKEANYRKTVELIRLGQLKRARANVTSKGCSDPTLPYIMEQMQKKFPKQK